MKPFNPNEFNPIINLDTLRALIYRDIKASQLIGEMITCTRRDNNDNDVIRYCIETLDIDMS
jgi:hypothetical protein